MTAEHPNVSLLKRLDLRNLDKAADLFAPGFIWHYFNPKLPDIQGDYVGVEGLQIFFEKVGGASGGTFKVTPISVTPMGDELIVAHVRDTMVLQDKSIALDAIAVWRVVDGLLAEAWDIPSLHTMASSAGRFETAG